MQTVSLFIPCMVDLLLPEIGEDTVRILRRLGLRIVYHERQTCCGQFSFNAGFWKEAARMARHFLEVFGDDEAVVCPSGSCVNMVRNRYPMLFAGEPAWFDRARSLATRVYELTEFIVGVVGVDDLGGSYEGKIAYHESCSLVNGLGVSEQPKRLLRSVRGAQLVPMRDAEVCCGFGGEFSTRYPEISESLVAAKTASFLESGADLLVLCEPGCLTNINGYLSRRHPDRKAVHIAQFLARSLPTT